MNTDELPEFVFDLLAKKDFNDLSANEKELCMAYMTAEDYMNYADIIRSVRSLDASIPVDPRAKIKVVKPNRSSSLLFRPVPFYQCAAAVILTCACCYFLFSQAITNRSTPDVEFMKADQIKGVPLAEDAYPEALIVEM